jgi:molybdopterin synthase sulfur carrier subunit
MMSVNVKYFASLRETIGRSSDQVSITGITTVEDIWQLATDYMERPQQLLVSVNQEYADFTKRVNDGDEVAFFPPVTGG